MRLGSNLAWRNPELVDHFLVTDPQTCLNIIHVDIVAHKLHHVFVEGGDSHRLALRRCAARVASDEVIGFESRHSRVWELHGLQRAEAERDLIREMGIYRLALGVGGSS